MCQEAGKPGCRLHELVIFRGIIVAEALASRGKAA